MREKKNIRLLKLEDVVSFCSSNNRPKFRAKQIWEWLWTKRATSFNDMTSLPISFRLLLNDNFVINPIKIHKIIRF